jgi:hypothetical protein
MVLNIHFWEWCRFLHDSLSIHEMDEQAHSRLDELWFLLEVLQELGSDLFKYFSGVIQLDEGRVEDVPTERKAFDLRLAESLLLVELEMHVFEQFVDVYLEIDSWVCTFRWNFSIRNPKSNPKLRYETLSVDWSPAKALPNV